MTEVRKVYGPVQSITLGWLQVAALLGAVQGLFLAGVLATHRSNRTANRLLAIALIAFCVFMMTIVYHAMELEQVFPHFFGAAYPLPFVFGPLIFLYAVTASDRDRGLRRWDSLHFLPFIAVVIAALPIYLMSDAEKLGMYQEVRQGLLPPVLRVLDPLKYASGPSWHQQATRSSRLDPSRRGDTSPDDEAPSRAPGARPAARTAPRRLALRRFCALTK
ncbi:MAG: hypothetical protein GEU90_06235 [Gemmatimonas sp.]|nr:hypothetical protein [Gemmatimonas sp.]